MQNENDKKEKVAGGFDWAEKIENIVESSVKGFMGGLAERIRERVREIILNIQKSLLGFFLLLVGFIFALVGVAMFFNDFLKMSGGMGYAIVGIIALLLGIIIIKK